MGHLLRLHERYKGRVAFLFVAIRDAGHPDAETSSLIGEHLPEGASPEARSRYVRKGLEAYKVPFPGLLDEDGQVERAYGANPKRLVIVGADGLVAYDGGRGTGGGPSDWDLEEVEERLRSALLPRPAP